jgi:DNA polymerase-4
MFQNWPRCIICVDMNAFFASVEQLLDPKLRKRPVAITNGHHGSCIITASYAARAYGIKTGMPLSQARWLCPDLIQMPARATIYESYSKRLMRLLHDHFTPDIEVFSVDEAFLDMTRVYHRYQSPRLLAQSIQDAVRQQLSLPCSVGISGDKTTAKYAAKCHKPMGVTVIEPIISERILAPLPVSELCGIGPRTTRYLSQYGGVNCGSVKRIPVSLLRKKFGIKGQRLWLMCAGRDPDSVRAYLKPAQSMGHSKILPPGVNSHGRLTAYLDAMAFKLAYRMQLQPYYSAVFFCKIAFSQRSYGYELALTQPTNQYAILSQWVKALIPHVPISSMVRRVQINALSLTQAMQHDLFESHHAQSDNSVEQLVADINARFGRSTLVPARLTHLLERIQATNVISPSWKGGVPNPGRQTIWD